MDQGKIVQVDEPAKLYSFPKTRFVADFIGHINQFEAQSVKPSHGHLCLAISGLGEIIAPPLEGVVAGDKGVFAIRPEQVRISVHGELTDLKNHFSGVVHDLLYRGDVSLYKVKLANGATIEALLPNSAPGRAELFEVSDTVNLGWRHDAGIFFMTDFGHKHTRAPRLAKYLMGGPPFLFLLLLFAVPSIIMVLTSFRYPGEFGGLAPLTAADPNILQGVTLETYQFFFNDLIYIKVFVKSFFMALATTLICLIMAYPLALLIALSPKKP